MTISTILEIYEKRDPFFRGFCRALRQTEYCERDLDFQLEGFAYSIHPQFYFYCMNDKNGEVVYYSGHDFQKRRQWTPNNRELEDMGYAVVGRLLQDVGF